MTAYERFRRLVEARGPVRGPEASTAEHTTVCPAHDDHTPSLDFREKGGKLVIRCRSAGCSDAAILDALGTSWRELLADDDGPSNGHTPPPAPGPRTLYTWHRLDGGTATHVRIGDGPGKSMPWDPKGTRTSDLRVYGAELLAGWDPAAPVWWAEGEKAADALRAAGLQAVSWTGKDTAPSPAALAELAGRRVIVWPDNDAEGIAQGHRIAAALDGIAADVRWLDPTGWAPKADAADILAPGATGHELHAGHGADPAAVAGILGRVGPVPGAAEDEDEDRYFLSPAQVYDGAPPVESVVPGIVAHGAVTNLDGKPKAGKTTFVMALIAAGLSAERRFLGHVVEFDHVIYLTEQGHDSLKEQLAAAGIGRDVVGRVDIVEWGDVHAKGWEGTLDMVRRRIARRYPDARVLLVVDTFSKWARTRDENDATATMDAYRPLLLLTQELRTATIAVRHGRKGDLEDVTDSARGSNAASGEADIVLHLGRAEGRPGEGRNVRRLRGVGRLGGIPEDLYVELRDGEYVALAEGEEYQSTQHRRAVLDALRAAAEPMTVDMLGAASDIARPRIQQALAELTHPTLALVTRTGAGKRGDPYRYAVSAQNRDTAKDPGTDVPVSAPNPDPATDNEFCAPSHAQGGPEAAAFGAPSGKLHETLSIPPHTRTRECPTCRHPHPVRTTCAECPSCLAQTAGQPANPDPVEVAA